jgi:hypothetical protein
LASTVWAAAVSTAPGLLAAGLLAGKLQALNPIARIMMIVRNRVELDIFILSYFVVKRVC